MNSFEHPTSANSDDESAEDDVPHTVAQESRITNLGSNLAIPSQSDMPGILVAFAILPFGS